MSTNKKRTGKLALPPSDHLRDIPTPLHAGEGLSWMPAEAIRRKTGLPDDDARLVDLIQSANARWADYRKALRAADVARLGDLALSQPATRRRRVENAQHFYNRARLAAWSSSLGEDGRNRWALLVAESILANRLNKRVPGVTPDLIPDLPRRCDLTDAAIDAAKALEQGEHWSKLRPGIEDAADAVIDEALSEMGWNE